MELFGCLRLACVLQGVVDFVEVLPVVTVMLYHVFEQSLGLLRRMVLVIMAVGMFMGMYVVTAHAYPP
jgi:hypothetical protein